MITINGRELNKREIGTIAAALDCYRDDVKSVAEGALKAGDKTAYTAANSVTSTCEQLIRAIQPTQAEPRGNHMSKQPPKIGEYWSGEGGTYAGIVRDTKTGTEWHLILGEGQSKQKWAEDRKEIPDCQSFTDGSANTKALMGNPENHPAARWASAIEIDGHRDFYLPAQKELNLIYINLQDKCAESWHWSSTQYSSSYAWIQDFGVGDQYIYSKDDQLAVRAVRRLPL